MRVEDAPPPGWYPDPEGGLRLRWWEGTDWADRWRAPPTPGAIDIPAVYGSEHAAGLDEYGLPGYSSTPPSQRPQLGGMSRSDSQEIINQVRLAARQEVERAASTFGREARSAANSIGPLISDYTNRFMRWVRIISVVAVIVFVAYIAFQVFLQTSMFDWIGDRIDHLTGDDESGQPVTRVIRSLV